MRPMKIGARRAEFEADARTTPLDRFASNRDEQPFDLALFQRRRRGREKTISRVRRWALFRCI
jgi:hypothetical protein